MEDLKNKGGFSIIAVMVTFAMLTVAMSALASMTTMSIKAQKGIEVKTNFDSFTESLRQTLMADTLCTPSLLNNSYLGSQSFRDPYVSTKINATVGDVHDGWTLTALEFRNVEAVPDQTDVMRATLFVEGLRDTNRSLGAPVMSREIQNVYFKIVSTTTTISQCYGTQTAWLNSAPTGSTTVVFEGLDSGKHSGAFK